MNEVERGNPPILEEETKKEYSEYFIADNIAANKFRFVQFEKDWQGSKTFTLKFSSFLYLEFYAWNEIYF